MAGEFDAKVFEYTDSRTEQVDRDPVFKVLVNEYALTFVGVVLHPRRDRQVRIEAWHSDRDERGVGNDLEAQASRAVSISGRDPDVIAFLDTEAGPRETLLSLLQRAGLELAATKGLIPGVGELREVAEPSRLTVRDARR